MLFSKVSADGYFSNMVSVAMSQNMTLQSSMVLECSMAEYTITAFPPALSQPPPQNTSLVTELHSPTTTCTDTSCTQLQSKARLCMLVAKLCWSVKSVLVRSTTVSLVSRLDRREDGRVDSFKPDRERLLRELGQWMRVM